MHKPWSDVIPCTYEMNHTLKELIRVKAFLLAGTTVSIVEEKVSRPEGSGLLLAGGSCVRILSNDPFSHPVVTFHHPTPPPPLQALSRKDKMGGGWGWGGGGGSSRSAARLRVESRCLDPLLACGTHSR